MRVARCVLGFLAFVFLTAAPAQPYPAKPVKLIVPFPPGGSTDLVARQITPTLGEFLGQQIVIEYKGGAAGSIGTAEVARAAADGYTLLIVWDTHAVNHHLYNVQYDFFKSFDPITQLVQAPGILVAHPSLPASNFKEFVAYLKANPGKLSYGSSGNGSSLHIGMELFLLKTGTKMTHVPYKGSAPMVTDLISGQVDASMDAATSSWPHVQTGKLRPLGVSTKERAFFAPDLPPIAQFVPGFDVKPWHGIMAPAKTPQPIVEKLSAEIQAFIKDPVTQQKLKDRGVVPVGSTAQEFAKVMNDEYELYKQVVKDAGIKPE
jgi:tripartite-type tricarboxylate transporter receptor subunit TctC